MPRGVDPALIGRTVAGKFTIESFIGAGAMGAVYKARQTALEKDVAIKVLHRELTADDTFTTRFKREAKAASRLDHPNSVRIIDFGVEADGTMYIAMELLDGRDLLRVLVEDWPLSSPRIAGILMQTLGALAVAHDLGVVHRDLKPENIMMLRGVSDEGIQTDLVKVCDFGIAKMTALRSEKSSQAGGPLTGQGLVVGTPEYMSPEQGRGDSLDLRSDLYSVGVILYQLLTGRLPFDAESALGIVFKHVTEEPIRPSVLNPMVDRRLETVCLRAMSKRREDRPQSAREMRSELRAILGGSMPFDLGAPSAARLGTDDTAPMPLMTRDRSSGLLPDAGGSDPEIAPAAPVPATSAPERPDRIPKTTSSVTALGERALPTRGPPPWLVGFALAAIGAVLVVAVAIHRSGARAEDDVRPATMGTASASASPGEGDASTASSTASGESTSPSASAATAASAASGPGVRGYPPADGVVSRAPRAPRVAPEAPVTAAAGATEPKTLFDLTTASANPSVAHADGASPKIVRSSLPSAQFTQCYREALARTQKRLEGTVSVHLQMSGDGRVTSALLSAPESLAQGLGRCITESFTQLPIPGVAAAGGAADIRIVFLPE